MAVMLLVSSVLDSYLLCGHRANQTKSDSGEDNKSSSTSWPLKMGKLGYPETSVRNYQFTLLHIPKEPRSQDNNFSARQEISRIYGIGRFIACITRLLLILVFCQKIRRCNSNRSIITPIFMAFRTAGFIILPELLPKFEAPISIVWCVMAATVSHVNITFCQARCSSFNVLIHVQGYR